jgi:hypothetical protein
MKARWLATAMLMGAFAHPAAAQSWDSPAFFAPGPHDDIGFYFIDADGGDLGFLGMWRQSGGTFNLGIRAGMGGPSGDRTALVGAEFAGDLVARRGAQPFGVSWLVGAGASFDGTTWLRIPAGVSIGITIPGPSFLLTPYIHPRLAIDVFSFKTAGGDDTDTELNADIDIGADLRLGDSWIIRIGGTSGQADAVGIGVAYRISRGAEVR